MQMFQNTLTFKHAMDAGDTSTKLWLDTAKALSTVNRKLIHQNGLHSYHGVCVFVKSRSTGAGVQYNFAASGAPVNWVTRNSIVKCFEAWKDQQSKVLSENSSIKPKWQDFKIYLNEDMAQDTSLHLQPVSGEMFGSDDFYNEGEWVYSTLVYESAHPSSGVVQEHEPELVLMGEVADKDDHRSLIQEYQDSRSMPFSPDPALPPEYDENMYTLTKGDLSDQYEAIQTNLANNNNSPPYDQDDYPGNNSNGRHPILYAFASNSNTVNPKVSLNGFQAPNGLLEFRVDLIGADPNAIHDVWIQVFHAGKEAY